MPIVSHTNPSYEKKSREGLVKRITLMRPGGMQLLQLRCALNRILLQLPNKPKALQSTLVQLFQISSFCPLFAVSLGLRAHIAVVLHYQFKLVNTINYIPVSFTFHECHVTTVLQSDWSRSIFNFGIRKCYPFDQTLSRLFCRRSWHTRFTCPSHMYAISVT